MTERSARLSLSTVRSALLALGLACAAMLASPKAFSAPESVHRDLLCAGMAVEQYLLSGARTDCLDDVYAIEVDFTEKWAEALGQALHYASETGRRPGIILICRATERTCLNHSLRLQATIAEWRLPVTLWECGEDTENLADCRQQIFNRDVARR